MNSIGVLQCHVVAGEFSNMSNISVVIPTFNSERTIQKCLESIMSQTVPPRQIVVVDGGSQDHTVQLAKSMGITVLTALPNRSVQRNDGAVMVTAPWVAFIDSDMVLTESVINACNKFVLGASKTMIAAAIPEKSVGTTFWAKSRALERSFYEGIWWIEAARLVKRDVFLKIGGYDSTLGELGGEDGDLDSRLRQHGTVSLVKDGLILHDEDTMSFGRLYRKKLMYGPTVSSRFELQNKCRARKQLRLFPRMSLFLRHPLRIARHPILFCGVTTIGLIEYFVYIQHRLGRFKPNNTEVHD